MNQDEQNKIIDTVLPMLKDGKPVSMTGIIAKKFPKLSRQQDAIKIVKKMEQLCLIEREDPGMVFGRHSITDFGEKVLDDFGGWLAFVEQRDEDEVRQQIQQEEDEEVDRQLKRHELTKAKYYWLWLILSGIVGALVAFFISNFNTVMGWFTENPKP